MKEEAAAAAVEVEAVEEAEVVEEVAAEEAEAVGVVAAAEEVAGAAVLVGAEAAVVVAVAAGGRVLSDQPWMLPWSACASSTRKTLQVPFADSPSKADSSTLPDGTGAGAGKTSLDGP